MLEEFGEAMLIPMIYAGIFNLAVYLAVVGRGCIMALEFMVDGKVKMGELRTAIIVAILLSTVSCSVISSQVRKEAEPRIVFKTLMEDNDFYIEKTVIVGGYILETKNLADQTSILVLQAPLGFLDEPKSRDDSEGRFIVLHQDKLDPEVYKRGRKITVAGTVVGLTTAKTEDCPNQCLNIESREMHLWPETYYYPRRYYPYGDPYPYYPRRLFPYDPTW